MDLTPIPTFPPIGSATFNADAYAWATFMAGTHQTELDALVTAVDADAATATAQVALAAAQVVLAEDQVDLATAQVAVAAGHAATASGAAATAGAVVWVSGTTYAIGDTRYSPADLQTYRRKTSGAGTTDPSADSTNWGRVVLGAGTGGAVNASGSVVLTSGSGGAQSVTPTTYGQSITLPDARTCTLSGYAFTLFNNGSYAMRVVDYTGATIGFLDAFGGAVLSLASTSTAAGVWNTRDLSPLAVTAQYENPALTAQNALVRVALDANRTCLVFYTTNKIYAIVYDASTQTWGSLATVRPTATNASFRALLSATNQVLVVSCDNSTAMEAVTLTVSSVTITVNTAATATLAGALSSLVDFIAVGTSWVVGYARASSVNGIRAMTISGTTVTIGAESALTGNQLGAAYLYAVSSTVVLTFSATGSTAIYAKPWTVSGSTLSAGTEATIASDNASVGTMRTFTFGTRWGVVFYGNSGYTSASVVSVSGTTATASTVQNVLSATTYGPTTSTDVVVYGNKAALMTAGAGSAIINIITDTAGTATQGTAVTLFAGTFSTVCAVSLSGAAATFLVNGSSGHIRATFDLSGASPVVSSTQTRYGSATDIQSVIATGVKDLARPATLLKGTVNYSLPSASGSSVLAFNASGLMSVFKQQGGVYLGAAGAAGAANEAWITGPTFASFQRIECVA